jgi:hypothetical protein
MAGQPDVDGPVWECPLLAKLPLTSKAERGNADSSSSSNSSTEAGGNMGVEKVSNHLAMAIKEGRRE